MFPSLEVRWFYAGMVPEAVLEWYQLGEGEPEKQTGRVDYYLRLGGRDSLGIKLREGRIEVKRRHRKHGILRFHERAAGLVEHWRKWSFELAPAEGDLSHSLMPISSWLGVHKERQLRKYRVAGDDSLVSVPAGEYPERGCSVELSILHVEGQDWWSLCFEAFGSEPSLHETLRLVTERILAHAQVLFPLDATDSYGYPRWLAMLGSPELPPP